VLISKIIFKNKKNIILIHFQVKSTLKNNRNHILKHVSFGNMIETTFPQISKNKFAKIYFLKYFFDHFDILILKIIIKNKKYHFNIFLNKKYFKS